MPQESDESIIVPGKFTDIKRRAEETQRVEPDVKPFDKESYQRNLKNRVFLTLEEYLTSPGARKVSKNIQGERNRNPDASLFSLIQEKLRTLIDNSDQELEKGLKQARQILINKAKERGILQSAKGHLRNAQEVNDYSTAQRIIRDINISHLEQEAKGLQGWSPDFRGMIDEYVDVADKRMDYEMLLAKGEGGTRRALKLKRDFDIRGWGTPPVALEKMARDYLEETAKKEKEEEEKRKGEFIAERVVRDEDITDKEEWKEIEEAEREILETCLEGMQKAVDLVGDNVNIYPYKEFLVDSVVENLKRYEKDKREDLVDVYGSKELPKRAEIILGRIAKMREWLEGNAAMLLGAGNVLVNYYDGWQMLELSVKQLRKDVRSRENHKLFAGLKKEELPAFLLKEDLLSKEKKWGLAEEIVSKQNQTFEILRGIAAAHRHKGRNIGRDIREKLEGDYAVTENQAKFIEKVFESKKKKLRTLRSKKSKGKEEVVVAIEGPDLVEVIAGLKTRNGAINELEKYFEKDKKGVRKVVIGEYLVITKKLLRSLSRRKLRDKTLWVDGVEWKLDSGRKAESLADIKRELEDKIGSGDKIFLGKEEDIKENDFRDIVGKTKNNQHVALIEETPAAIDNLFVMAQTAQAVDEAKEKVAVMLNMGLGKDSLWERLRGSEVDVVGLVGEFNLKWKEYREKGGSILDRHIIDMSRITLLYFLEGADLGWGFEYEEKEIGKGEKKTKVTKQVVSEGGAKAATDAAAPFKWLRTQASSNWKDWTRAILPMDQVVAKQILEHYPGWAPQKKGNKWRITFMGKPLEFIVPTTLDMSFLKTLKIPVEIEGGIIKDKRAMELVCDEKRPLKMSEIPWLALLSDEARYRAFINERAMGLVAGPLTKPLDKETIETFFGEEMFTPRTIEAQEYLKRAELAFRDIQTKEMEDTMSLIPFVEALHLAWRWDMLPSSRKPVFHSGDIKRLARNTATALEELAPRGRAELGKDMANKFDSYIQQLIPACGRFTREMAKKRLASRRRKY